MKSNFIFMKAFTTIFISFFLIANPSFSQVKKYIIDSTTVYSSVAENSEIMMYFNSISKKDLEIYLIVRNNFSEEIDFNPEKNIEVSIVDKNLEWVKGEVVRPKKYFKQIKKQYMELLIPDNEVLLEEGELPNPSKTISMSLLNTASINTRKRSFDDRTNNPVTNFEFVDEELDKIFENQQEEDSPTSDQLNPKVESKADLLLKTHIVQSFEQTEGIVGLKIPNKNYSLIRLDFSFGKDKHTIISFDWEN